MRVYIVGEVTKILSSRVTMTPCRLLYKIPLGVIERRGQVHYYLWQVITAQYLIHYG